MKPVLLRILLSIFATVFLMPSIAYSASACSSKIGQVVINEYNYINNYVELKVLNASLTAGGVNPFEGWKLAVWKKQGAGMTLAKEEDVSSNYTDVAKNSCRSSRNYTYVKIPFAPSEMANDAIVVLWETSGSKVVDLLRVGQSDLPAYPSSINSGYAKYSQCSTIENSLPSVAYDAPLTGSSGNKDIARRPDGTGPWTISTGTGANSQESPCAKNDALLTVTKTPSSTTVGVGSGSTFTWTVTVKNNGTSGSMTNVTASDSLPANMYLSLCPSGATCTGSAGAYTSFSKNVGTLAESGGSATITATAYVSLAGTYTNTVSATATELLPGYTLGTGSITTIAGPNHYELSLPIAGVSCLATTVTVSACADSSSPCTSAYTAASGTTATLASSGGTLGASTVTFNSSGVATTTLVYPAAANGAAVSITLSGEQAAAANPRQCCPNGTSCSAANSCSTTFNTAGFIFSAAANGAAALIPSQVAGTSSSTYYLRAIKTSSTTKACEAALSGGATVNFAYECNNPSTCSASNLMRVDGGTASTISRNNNGSVSSYAAVNMNFDNSGNAPFTINFGDAGQVTLYASKAASGSLLATLTGASNAFVTKPAGFSLAATCGGTTNAASQSAPGVADPKFCPAGQNFSAAVSALTSGGIVTPNYGRETAPETIAATWSRYLPSTGGVDGTLPSGALAFSGGYTGTFTASGLKWSEVGILSAALTVGDSDYLGAGNVTSTAYVGRFYPDHFDVVVTPQCGGFVYSGQPAAPVATGQPFTVKATAMNALSTPTATSNYNSTAGFSKPVNLTLSAGGGAGKLYVDAMQGGAGAIPASKFGSGAGIVNFNDTTGRISYVFDVFPTLPTTITLHAEDADAATSTGTDGSTSVRAGRLRMLNAYGSELLDLPMSLTTQYWNGSAYVLNTSDSCTSLPVPTAANGLVFGFGNLAAGETIPSINAVTSGSGTVVAGDAVFKLTKPGTGNNGYVDITVNGPAWLKYVWAGSTATNPTARATFGIYKSPLIYRRENY